MSYVTGPFHYVGEDGVVYSVYLATENFSTSLGVNLDDAQHTQQFPQEFAITDVIDQPSIASDVNVTENIIVDTLHPPQGQTQNNVATVKAIKTNDISTGITSSPIKAGPGRPRKDGNPPYGSQNMVQCSICEEIFKTKFRLSKHMKNNHLELQTVYKCNKCSANFTCLEKSILHASEHWELGGACPIPSYLGCQTHFKRKAVLIGHLTKVHLAKNEKIAAPKNATTIRKTLSYNNSMGNPYKCETCPKSFDKPSHLLRHNRIHTGETPYKCSFCPRSFNQQSTLTTHKLIHLNKRPYKCRHCDASFRQAGNRRIHERRLHPPGGAASFLPCPYCACVFKFAQNLNSHMQKAHENLTEEQTMANTMSDVMKNLELMSNKPKSRVDILQTALSDSGVTPPMKPDNTSIVFRACGDLKDGSKYECKAYGIVKSHTSNSYNCQICNAKFTKSSDLIRHIPVHERDHPFQCDLCDMKFTLSSQLKLHKKSIHQVKKKPHPKKNTKNNGQKAQMNNDNLPIILSADENNITVTENALIHDNDMNVFVHNNFLNIDCIQPGDIDNMNQTQPPDKLRPPIYEESLLHKDANILFDPNHLQNNFVTAQYDNFSITLNPSSIMNIQDNNIFENLVTLNNDPLKSSSHPYELQTVGEQQPLTNNVMESITSHNVAMYGSENEGITIDALLNQMHGSTENKVVTLNLSEPNAESQMFNIGDTNGLMQVTDSIQNDHTLISDISLMPNGDYVIMVDQPIHNSLPVENALSDENITKIKVLSSNHPKEVKKTLKSGKSIKQTKLSFEKPEDQNFSPPATTTDFKQTINVDEIKRRYFTTKQTKVSDGKAIALKLFLDKTRSKISTEPAPYKCTSCPKSFTKLSDLQRHTTTHTRVKAFQCEVCSKSFTLKSTLVKHKAMIHSDSRKVQCKVCGKWFASKSSMMNHMKIHSGKLPFACTLCSSAFRTSGSLTFHLAHHHFSDDAESVGLKKLKKKKLAHIVEEVCNL